MSSVAQVPSLSRTQHRQGRVQTRRAIGVLAASILWLGAGTAYADPFTSIDRDIEKNQSYRTDYGERKLEAGVDVGVGVLGGTTAKAFDPSLTLTPYFDVSFGDGNSLDFQVTLGYHPLDPDQAEYYFFRSPQTESTVAEGELQYAIPHLSFRYESDLTPKLGKRGRAFFWAAMGMGVGLVSSAAQIENAGTIDQVETSHEDTRESFFAVVPSLGFRFRATEFLFFNVTARAAVLTQFGRPDYLKEGDLEGLRTFDTSVGISYEFGPT